MSTESIPTPQDHDHSPPSNERPRTPSTAPVKPNTQSSEPSYMQFNSESLSTPNTMAPPPIPPNADLLNTAGITDKQCRVCNKKFGVRRMRRKHTCRRCGYKVCGNHSSKKRYDSSTDQMVRVCDKCLSGEHCIVMTHRLRNLKLKHNKRNRGTYIVKVANTSKEYGEGLVNKCKIIEINEQNVESLNAQLIADKLNTIKIPFSITLDYSEAEIKHDQLKKLNRNRKSVSPNKGGTDHKKESKSPAKSDNKAIGTTQLINAQQNPSSPYYYGPPQQFIAPAPVIVTGPSSDIRSIYKLPPLQPSYSDSYNEPYLYDPREETGVMYDESPQKKMMNGRGAHEDDTEEDGEVTSSENEEESEENTENEATENEEEDGTDGGDRDATPELMQYEDTDHEQEPMESGENNAEEIQHHAHSDDEDDTHKPTIELEHVPHNVNGGTQVKPLPLALRSKSVPATPKLIGLKAGLDIVRTEVEDMRLMAETPVVSMTLPSEHMVDHNKTSYTPKGDKSTNVLFKESVEGNNIATRPRSWSQDNLNAGSPPLVPQIHAQVTRDDAEEDTHHQHKKKKKSGIFRRKQKKKKKKKRKKEEKTEDDVKKRKFFRKKGHRKSMENYMNLHNNLNDDIMKPVMHSNVREYTTQNLHAPNYSANNPGIKPHYPSKQAVGAHGVNANKYKLMQQQRQRMEMQQHIAQSNHLLVNPYRQFSIAFDRRPFNIKLQFRNGFTTFMHPTSQHIQQSHTLTRPEYIWGWYSVQKHPHIPIGSKLISINFEWIYGKNQREIAELMYNSALPTTLLFEAPSYLNHVPPSVHMQLTDRTQSVHDGSDTDRSDDIAEETQLVLFWDDVLRYAQSHQSIIFWWMEEGGCVLIALIILALFVLDTPCLTQLYYQLPIFIALITILIMNIPQNHNLFDMIWNAIHDFVFKLRRRRRIEGLELFGLKLFKGDDRGRHPKKVIASDPHVSISNQHSLLPMHGLVPQIQSAQPIQSRRSTNLPHSADVHTSPHIHKKRSKKRKRNLSMDRPQEQESSPSERDEKEDKEEEDEEEEEAQTPDPIQLDHDEEDVDPNWETNVCFPGGNTEVWGSYSPCTAKTLKLRGATYLTDKIKIYSQESLLSLANMDIFTVHHRIHHMAQNEVSWFHQNRKKLPRSLFFIIIHLRLDSMTASVVQYFYIDRNKFKHLLESNETIGNMAKEKGDGYFAIGGDRFDESGMFWNFINGPCKYRNDRLKLLARKEEGPWYMQIPSRPAIIGRQVPIEYYRGYNANHLNTTKIHSTRSHSYEPYDFKTLYHDPDVDGSARSEEDKKEDVPCHCGKCLWINTNGEYPDYLEIDITPEVNAVAKRTVRMAVPLAKSLQVEMQWTMEGQINNVELPERMLCSARIIHADLTKLIELD